MTSFRKILIASAVAVPMLVGQAVADLADILASGTVKIAIPESFAPFGALGASGEYEGYDVDVAKLIAADLGVELELVPVTSNQRIPFLETDRVDLVIATMGANPERAKSIWFSAAYAPFFSGAFAASGKSIGGVADLAGMSVGLTGGTLEDLELTKIAPETTQIIRFGDNAATRAAFESGQVDVLVSGNTVAAAISAADPAADVETKFILKESPAFIGVKKGNLDLLFWVNTFILHKTLGGELNTLSNTWLGQDLPALPKL
ncbi:transporter substrate-binding domain-containing protein [Algirhabdus cladophorae]|uniref:transporter substrate-binding domain-containing protein n=1 Tax=Algirhabdus cladophorae TaxID=3377108 RepID=UPI003B847545